MSPTYWVTGLRSGRIGSRTPCPAAITAPVDSTGSSAHGAGNPGLGGTTNSDTRMPASPAQATRRRVSRTRADLVSLGAARMGPTTAIIAPRPSSHPRETVEKYATVGRASVSHIAQAKEHRLAAVHAAAPAARARSRDHASRPTATASSPLISHGHTR